MSTPARNEPSDDELVAFAKKLLSYAENSPLSDETLIRESVRETRQLWVKLYEASVSETPDPRTPD